MRNKIVSVFLAVMFLSLVLTGFSFAQSKSKPIELRFNYSMPAKMPPANGWEWFGRELERRTRGRVKVTYFPHGALFKIRQAVENIIAGTADITNISVRTFASRYPLLSVTLLPTIMWPNTVEGTVAGGRAIMKLIEEFPEVQRELRDFKVLWVTQLEAYHLISKKPVYRPSDLKGMKIGAGGIQGKFVTQQGGSGVALVPPKSYMSLKTGVVDGMIMSWNAMGIYKLWEVAGYVSEVTMGRVPLPIVMNKESWNSLPPDIQKLVLQIGDESFPMSVKGMYQGGVKGKKLCIQNGVKVFTPTGEQEAVWKEAFKPLEAQWLAAREKQGIKAAPAVLNRFKEMAAASWK
ncbi:MAG: TRAP transporter substrate-binding protein DctP [Deltaproteobacteria bacterium]|nr:TRAP transporter substrate-binding protein DctP [Deltaproteobacteria bacterium]